MLCCVLLYHVLRCLTRALRTEPMPVLVPFWYQTSALLVNKGLRLVVCNESTKCIGGMNAVRSTIDGMKSELLFYSRIVE